MVIVIRLFSLIYGLIGLHLGEIRSHILVENNLRAQGVFLQVFAPLLKCPDAI